MHNGTGSGGMHLPPGFGNLVSSQGAGARGGSAASTREEQPSSTTSTAAIHGIFPFPPARNSPWSPPSSPSPPSPGSSTRPEVSSVYSDDRDKMDATNAYFLSHHHDQVMALMSKKFQDLLDYDKTKNRKILHVDWIAGNPTDPIKKEGSGFAAAHGGMSAEDRKLSESVARSVMRITYDVKSWDEAQTWNKALFYGDWLNDHRGLHQFFLEIQVKRISGADDELLQKSGISHEYVWLSLNDDKAPAITPIVVPPLIRTGGSSQVAPRELPATPDDAAREADPEVEEEEFAAPAPASPTMQVPTSSADKGKGKAVAPDGQASGASHAAPVIVSSQSAQSPQQRTPLPDISNLALRQQAAEDTPIPSIEHSAPPTGIPRSQPLRTSGSFDSIERPHSEASGTTDSSYEDEGTIYLGEDVDPTFAALLPAHQAPTVSAADLNRRRQEFERNAIEKREELKRIYSFLLDDDFIARKNKSFIYAVRVLAIPDRGSVVNDFAGPRIDDRYGTLIGQGGWVVPPLEERARWRDEHKRAYRNKGAKPGRYDGLPRPQVQNAMPLKFDWSAAVEPRYYGPAPPVWRELCDPCLEDIYWMVWQLLGGKQFLGFGTGAGFGKRREAEGDPAILEKCPFKSPSTEALYHAASYPRGKEQ